MAVKSPNKFIAKFQVPSWARGLMPTLIVSFITSLLSGLIMVYIIGNPVAIFNEMLTTFLRSMGTSFNLIMGALIDGLY